MIGSPFKVILSCPLTATPEDKKKAELAQKILDYTWDENINGVRDLTEQGVRLTFPEYLLTGEWPRTEDIQCPHPHGYLERRDGSKMCVECKQEVG